MADVERARAGQSVLFVGGPVDGDWRRVDPILNTVQVAVYPPADFGESPAAAQLATYTALEITDGLTGGSLFWIYVHESVRFPLARLARAYGQQRGKVDD